MPYPIQEFWQLAVQSQLFAPEECQRLAGAFAQIRGATETGNAFTLSEWLIAQRVLTRYQAKVLLARRAGPFVYGDYKVQERIDAGRLQGLFRAVHVPTRAPVCLAFLSGPQLQDPHALARLKQALAAAEFVKHPHLARLYHFVDLESYKFAVLPDLQGRSVDEFLAARGPFSAAEACRLARQAALGLAELHKSGQMHGEVRPANLWLEPANNIKLLHLPISRDPMAAPGTVASESADYLAPELAAPSRWPATPLSDLYALGCTLYHLLVGQPPFAGGDAASKLRRHVQEQPPLANQVNPKVPPPIAQVVGYLMAKDPAGRYQQALHVAEALAPYVEPAAREPVVEPSTSTLRAYEEWLGRQQPPPARTAPQLIPMPPAPSPPMPAPMPAMMTAVATATLAPPLQPAFAAPAASELPQLESRTNVAVQRKEKQLQERRNKLIVGATLGVLVVVIAIVLFSSIKDTKTEVTQEPVSQPAPGPTSVATNTPKPPEQVAAPAAHPEEPLTSVDAQPIWESPTTGEPLDLRYLPAATKMFLALRPAEIWADAEGQRVLASLGIKDLVGQELLRLSGASPDNLEQVILGFSGRGMGQMPAMWLVARAKTSLDEETLKRNWTANETIQIDGKRLYRGDGRTCYAPSDAENKLLVSAPLTDEKELAAWLAGSKSPPLLDRHLEALLRSTDGDRHVTVLASPKFLFNEGRSVWMGTLAGLVDPCQAFLINVNGESPGGVLFSLHLSESLFLELRASEDNDAAALSKLYRSRVQGLQDAVEQHIGTLNVSPYSLKIMLRYPGFFGFINDHTRAGTSDKQAVLRTVLPPVAASNLAFSTHLAMLESGTGYAVSAPQVQEGAVSLADRFKQKYTLTFDRDALDRTLAVISQDTGIPIKIEGGDLLLEGITQNQSFGLDEKDKPVAEILRIILKKANPDGKLIYVFQKRDGQDTLVITTRSAAAKRGDAIPPELK